MHYAPHVLCLIGSLAILFGYWGLNTPQGRQTFDEMAGIIPMAVGGLGSVFFLVGLIWLIVRARAQ